MRNPEKHTPDLFADATLNGFTKRDLGGGKFELLDGSLVVHVEPSGDGKFQASHLSARSSPHLRGIEGVVAWASNIRNDGSRSAS